MTSPGGRKLARLERQRCEKSNCMRHQVERRHSELLDVVVEVTGVEHHPHSGAHLPRDGPHLAAEVTCMCRPVDLPWARHARDLTLAPVVEVRRGEIVLAGEFLGRIGSFDVDGAAERLSQLGSRGGERTVVIAADHELRFAALWPVMQAVFRSGASTVSLAVEVPQ